MKLKRSKWTIVCDRNMIFRFVSFVFLFVLGFFFRYGGLRFCIHCYTIDNTVKCQEFAYFFFIKKKREKAIKKTVGKAKKRVAYTREIESIAMKRWTEYRCFMRNIHTQNRIQMNIWKEREEIKEKIKSKLLSPTAFSFISLFLLLLLHLFQSVAKFYIVISMACLFVFCARFAVFSFFFFISGKT